MRRGSFLLFLLALLPLASCRWSIPSSILTPALSAPSIAYDDAPLWNGGKSCSGTFTSGADTLRRFISARFPDEQYAIGGYSCRQNTANKAKTSVHGSGRALDVMVKEKSGAADSAKGDVIANYLVRNCGEIGVQYVIWDQMSFSCSRRSDRFRKYTGPNPHTDHLHVEINLEASRKKEIWWADRDTVVPIAPPNDPDARAPSIAPPVSGEGYEGYECHERGGTCMSHLHCARKGKSVVSRLCPGDSSIKCCIGLCQKRLPEVFGKWREDVTGKSPSKLGKRIRRMRYSAFVLPEDISENQIACTAFAVSTAMSGGTNTDADYSKISKFAKTFTFGRFGISLTSGVLVSLVKAYCLNMKVSALCQNDYVSRLANKDVTLIFDPRFFTALIAAGRTSSMKKVQDTFVRNYYFREAKRLCGLFNLHSPLAITFCFDTHLQGGLNSILNRARFFLSGVPGINGITEQQFVIKASELRVQYLEKILKSNAKAPVERAQVITGLLKDNGVLLKGDIDVKGHTVPGVDKCTDPAGGKLNIVRRENTGTLDFQK